MSTHAHHWIIDSPAGPTSQGVCLTCNATKLFANWHQEGHKPSRERWRNGLKAITERRYTTKGDYAMRPYYEGAGITLYHGDCRDVLPTLAPVDHVITDPPYARDVYQRLSAPITENGSGTPARMGIRNHQYSSTAIEKLAAGAIGSVDDLLEPCAVEFARLVRRWCLTFSDAESTHRWRELLEAAGARYVRTGAWVKPDAMPQFSGDRPSVGFELCTIVHAPGPMRWNGGGHAAVWTYNTVKGGQGDRPDHPCPKPLPLMRELVTLFTDPGETILDPFAGSGTTLLAAKLEGRRAIGIELEEKWCELTANRLRYGTKGAALVASGQAAFDMEKAR